MAKKLLVAPAGSGKTYRLLDEFVEALKSSPDPLNEDTFFLLPSAEHVDRAISLVLQRGLKGFFFRRITTLSSLIKDVFSIHDQPVISESSRMTLIREVLSSQNWLYFEEVQNARGFAALIHHFLMELKDSLITPEDFRVRMNQIKLLEPQIASKYEALAGIYEAYQTKLKEQGVCDRQDLFGIYLERKRAGGIRKHRFSKLWLDGFFDFSPLQFEFVRELSEISEDVVVTLTKDTDEKRAELFQLISETERNLESLGFIRQTVENQNKTKHYAEPLVILEKELFSDSKQTKTKASALDCAIQIYESVGTQGEIEMIAREIRRLHKQEALRFSDCAILLRQIGSYEAVIRSVFSRYGIPVEIHERERLGMSPLIQTVIYLLKIFSQDWQRSDLFNFLKSAYVRRFGRQEKSFEEIATWEIKAFENGIVQGRDSWNFIEHPFMQQLKNLEDALKAAKSYPDMKRLVLGRLRDFGLFDMPESDEAVLRRDAATLRRFEAILDEIDHHLTLQRKTQICFEDFCDQFLRLVDLDLFSIRETDKNLVQVYDISLARQKEYKVVFVAGLLERSFPVLIRENPVLSDWERRLINHGSERPLAEVLPRQSLERYLFYVAVTRARQKLYLTYPRLDREGKEALPSFYVDEVRSVFQDPIPVVSQDLSRPYPSVFDAMNTRELEASVMGGFWHASKDEEPLLLVLTNQLLENSESRELFRKSFYEVRAELHDEKLRQTEAFQIQRTSATKLEEYAKCPFKYYSRYILKLSNPEEDVNPMRKGIILHQILERFFFKYANKSWTKLSWKAVAEFIEQEMEIGLREFPLIYERFYQRKLAVEEMKECLSDFFRIELARLREANLQPFFMEFNFGAGRNSNSEALEVDVDGKKIKITGKIDRVDADPSKKFGLVLDYKSSAEFNPAKMELGTALQLSVYLSALKQFLKLEPIGGELYSLKEVKRRGFYHEENARDLMQLSARAKKYPAAEFEAVLTRSWRFIRKFIGGIQNLEIPVRPRECDKHCPYDSICRVHKWELEQILEEIKADDLKEGLRES